jgi:hypothetical protein
VIIIVAQRKGKSDEPMIRFPARIHGSHKVVSFPF